LELATLFMSNLSSQSICLPESIELSVIINSFNRLQLLREALPSVINALNIALPGKFAVVIFDAGSTDGSIEFVSEFYNDTQEFPLICLCPPLDVDRSFSAGCNLAIQKAAQTFPNLKWCFLFETDNLITNPTALTLSIKLLEQEDHLAGVGFTVEGANFCSSFPNFIAFVLGQQLSYHLGLEKMKIHPWYPFAESQWGYSEVVFTSPILIRYSAWQATGGMDAANFPFSDCDHDWCWAVHKQGWRLAVLNVSGVIHFNKMIISEWSSKRVIDFHRARLRLLVKHRGQQGSWLNYLLFLRHILEIFVLISGAVYSEKARKSFFQRQILIRSVWNNYEITDIFK
jgi:GT2 family glycosyltransferase